MSAAGPKVARIETFLMQAGAPSQTASSRAGGLSLAGSRHWLFVRVTAEDGTYGVGEGSGWPKVVCAAIEDMAPLVIGEDAVAIERIWSRLHLAQMGHGQTGTVGGGAITAIEMALWDLNAKLLGVPVWRLFGGKLRDVVPAYAHAGSPEGARRMRDLGYRAFKTGGVTGVVEKAFALREALGPEAQLMVDMHGPPWATAADARRIARALEPLNLLFLEEPIAPEFPNALRDLRQFANVPLAAGERTAKLWGLAPLVMSGAIDVAQPDTGRFGGLSQMRKVAAVAEACGVSMAPHSGTLGPVAEFAALHLMATLPNALVLERFGEDWARRGRVVTAAPELRDGGLVVPDGPGLGVDLDVEAILAHPPAFNAAVPQSDAEYALGTAGSHAYLQARSGPSFGRAR